MIEKLSASQLKRCHEHARCVVLAHLHNMFVCRLRSSTSTNACLPRLNRGPSMFWPTMRAWLSFCPSTARTCGYHTLAPSAMGCSRLPRGRSGIGRAFYCFTLGRRIVVLHAFIKKSQQTPDRELKLARKRLKELQDG
jgi:hypothetical protein